MLVQLVLTACLLCLAQRCLAQLAVHDPMGDHIYLYPQPVDMPHHIYVKPTDLVTRDPTAHRLQFVTDWPYPGVMGSHTLKPTDLVATAEVSSQPIYFRGVDSTSQENLSKKKNILYVAFPLMRHYDAPMAT